MAYLVFFSFTVFVLRMQLSTVLDLPHLYNYCYHWMYLLVADTNVTFRGRQHRVAFLISVQVIRAGVRNVDRRELRNAVAR